MDDDIRRATRIHGRAVPRMIVPRERYGHPAAARRSSIGPYVIVTTVEFRVQAPRRERESTSRAAGGVRALNSRDATEKDREMEIEKEEDRRERGRGEGEREREREKGRGEKKKEDATENDSSFSNAPLNRSSVCGSMIKTCSGFSTGFDILAGQLRRISQSTITALLVSAFSSSSSATTAAVC